MSDGEVLRTVQAFQQAIASGAEPMPAGPSDGAAELFTHPDDLRDQALLQALQERSVGQQRHARLRVCVASDAALKAVPEMREMRPNPQPS